MRRECAARTPSLAIAWAKLEDAIDRIKAGAGDVPLIAVGGGAFLVPGKLAGVSEVIRVEHGECANAVGAAITPDQRRSWPSLPRDHTRGPDRRRRGASGERAVASGADRASLQTIEVEDMPIADLPGNALRVRVRVAGEMRGFAGQGARAERTSRARLS
jgi:hypothetical protein